MTGGPDRIRVLDLEGVKDKAGFMDRCVRDLELPDWFGRNWDALFDVLTDVSFWPDGSEQALLLSVVGWRPYASARPEDWETALDVFTDAVDRRRGRNPRLVIALTLGGSDHTPSQPPV
ncbi:barstar family protein [Streptomyces sp. NPDC056121]|jgi:hypothetical protein|uniref:Barstar family protein n=2 Tax=Streptomyces TaxID=1883 RepID=A0AAU1UHD0_9ACTN|nr:MULTISPECIES: barstar family protein [Streptomyces]MCX4646737.1 barstar family protein [Streptomyces sp. NBC_01446]MCX5080417.1 barstar family protein [Streptomyces sp. NBC_00401]MCX5319367.1 barstar family protein [Streptomyces sp. NBC_00120]UDL98656.1 barstar family protein [Streptomyces longhuiensis]WSD99449.1 barstar family protein [Streptomyces sp. NBC_01474]